jgi:hypothetical protein
MSAIYYNNHACIQDVLANFQNVTSPKMVQDHAKNGIFYFTHSGALLKFLAFLGLDKPLKPPKHDNYYDHQHEQSYWSTSKVDSFATNVAFVLESCDGEKKYFKVGMMINEQLTPIPGNVPQLIIRT